MPRQEPGLVPRQGRSAQGDHPVDTVLVQAEQVHVSFHDQYPPPLPHRVPGLVQPVEHVAFAINGGFRRIEILGLIFVGKRSPPEPDHAAARGVNRKDEPVS